MSSIWTDESTQGYVSRNAAFLVILGGLLAMLGLIALASPFAAGLAVEFVIGIMVLSRGAMQMYYGFKVRHWGKSVGSYMGLGSIMMSFVSVACGVLLLANPVAGLSFLTLLITAYLIVNGGFDMLHSLELRSVEGWYWMLLNGVVSIALGMLIWSQWPLSGMWALGVMVGANLFFSGLSMVGLGWSGRWYLLRQKDDQFAPQQA